MQTHSSLWRDNSRHHLPSDRERSRSRGGGGGGGGQREGGQPLWVQCLLRGCAAGEQCLACWGAGGGWGVVGMVRGGREGWGVRLEGGGGPCRRHTGDREGGEDSRCVLGRPSMEAGEDGKGDRIRQEITAAGGVVWALCLPLTAPPLVTAAGFAAGFAADKVGWPVRAVQWWIQSRCCSTGMGWGHIWYGMRVSIC